MKNKNAMLICCILGGWFGLHHFINGKVGKGILYLFTMGLFGIGWLIDIIVIATSKEVVTNTNNRICLKCGTIIKNEKISYCPNCGYDLNSYKNQPVMTFRMESYETGRRKSLYSKTRTKQWVEDYIVFDLETTGFNPNDDRIIEIGALKYKNNELVDSFNYLVNPKCKLSKEIVDITGITDEMLKNCETIDTVLPKFINFIEDYTLIAHNGSFDLGFIENNINNLNLPMIKNKNIDTLYLARENINTPNHKLETLKKHFKLDFGSHRAIEDCLTTNYIYQYCKDKNTVTN